MIRHPEQLSALFPFPGSRPGSEERGDFGQHKLREYLLKINYDLPVTDMAKDFFAQLDNLREPESDPEFFEPGEESEQSVVDLT